MYFRDLEVSPDNVVNLDSLDLMDHLDLGENQDREEKLDLVDLMDPLDLGVNPDLLDLLDLVESLDNLEHLVRFISFLLQASDNSFCFKLASD